MGIENAKRDVNIGTLLRSAYAFGAAYTFTIGQRYKPQSSDTAKSHYRIPLFRYLSFDEFYNNIPYGCRLVGVEIDERARPLESFVHPDRAIYILGAEDNGLSKRALAACHSLVVIPSAICLNVAVAGSIVLADRIMKIAQEHPPPSGGWEDVKKIAQYRP